MKHLGEENLTMDRYEDSSIEELLSKLDFAPGKGFELEALGTKYDYVVCIFFHSGLMIKRYVNVLELQSDSVRANPYSRVALIPVCTDANRKVFPTRKAYKRAIYDKLSEE
ncbi:MAG: hypothetical protein CSA04_04525 [Bacteroidetes bacterium]|nr:MAG: hypothetical protein CSA04_04525 [Bacteroidota bacterium]